MEEIIKTFHLDIKGIIAQLINFGIVVFVLFKFAYKPLLKKMNERSDIIERGLKDARKSQEELKQAEKIREEKVLKAKKEAIEVLENAQKIAETNKAEMVKKAKEEAEKIVIEARKQIQSEKEKAFKEVKANIGELISLGLEKIFKNQISIEQDKTIVEETIKELKK